MLLTDLCPRQLKIMHRRDLLTFNIAYTKLKILTVSNFSLYQCQSDALETHNDSLFYGHVFLTPNLHFLCILRGVLVEFTFRLGLTLFMQEHTFQFPLLSI